MWEHAQRCVCVVVVCGGGGSKLSEITGMEVIDMKDNEVSKSDSTHQLVACFGTVSPTFPRVIQCGFKFER